MRQSRLSIYGAAFAALVILSALSGAPASGDALFKHASLSIETKSGPIALNVEVADTEPQRERGLMFRRKLGTDQGMIFLFDGEQDITMWMKNTYISLDMVFIGDDWRIVHIAEDAEPLSTDIIPSMHPASRVLEIAGGQAKKLGLAPGDLVTLKQ
jgi:hypothetical protein